MARRSTRGRAPPAKAPAAAFATVENGARRPYPARIETQASPELSACATCTRLEPIGEGPTTHDASGAPSEGALELVLHGDGPDAHDFHTGRPGSFDALFEAASGAKGRPVLVTVPLTRSVARVVSAIPLLVRARGAHALRFHVPMLREGTHPTLVPRLALAIPFALHALSTATKLELPAFVSGAPLCLLGPYATARIETPPRAYAAVCEGCPARSSCPGADPRYLATYGERELRALPLAPPPPSSAPLAEQFAR